MPIPTSGDHPMTHDPFPIAGLSAEEREVVAVVAKFVDEKVRPVAAELERSDTYPEVLIEQMKELGVFGLVVPEPYGDASVSTPCFALVTEELARGWMSLAGAFGGHSVVANLIARFGLDEQRERYLPQMASGQLRGTMALTEPDGGSDLQAIRTRAALEGDKWVIDGTKLWISNARHSDLIALLVKTDPEAVPAHRGISILLVEKGEGVTVSRDLGKLGYRGVESCEIHFSNCCVPASAVLGGQVGQGFSQMMTGLELGRIQVAARAVGVARAAYDASLVYSQERTTFDQPIWRHQSIGNYLADMATGITAARLLTLHAAATFDSGARADLEAGMAKLFASEVAATATLNSLRIHGANGYSTEYPVERYYRDAPLMIVGEGTNEIQRNVIAQQLIRRSADST
jgi:alkylation response protein AidB-like acyl-CoA dehydrogenase